MEDSNVTLVAKLSDLLAQAHFLVYSTRLRTSLGLCYPERNLILLHPALQDRLAHLYVEVLCHELAHLIVYQRHGRAAKPHGPEWRELVELAGYKPRRLCLTELDKPNPAHYIHRCPVCQATRTSTRRQPRWKCRDCVDNGLDGTMVIETLAAP